MGCLNMSSSGQSNLAAVSLASSGIGAVGGLMSGLATSKADKYNAQVAQQNAQIAKQDATWAGQAGEAQASIEEGKTRAIVGKTLANQAASNIDVHVGSAPDVRTSEKAVGALNALTIRSNATREAYGFQTQAVGFENQAALDKSAAKNAEIAGATTFLGGIGSGTANWLKFQSSGLLSPPSESISPDLFGGNSGGGTNPNAY